MKGPMQLEEDPDKRRGEITVQWAAIAAVAGASAAVIGALAFGMGFASLPVRVQAIEVRQEKFERSLQNLTDELQAGRKERLQFQGDTKSDLAVLKANVGTISDKIDELKRVMEGKKP